MNQEAEKQKDTENHIVDKSSVGAVMCCGYWEKFTGQELQTSDLVWFQESGLAFVDSSLTTGEPDRFTSIPENWSFGSSVMVNQRKYDKYGSSHVKKDGWVYRDKDWVSDAVPAKWDRILYVCKVRKP